MKVLVVDNDHDLLDLMTYALRREGYDVITAADGLQAIERFRVETPDIVLLEAQLPKLSGFEVCTRIRHIAEVPIIFVTARAQEQHVLRGLQVGADDYVAKPFSIKQVAARMQTVLRRCHTDQYRKTVSKVQAGDLGLC